MRSPTPVSAAWHPGDPPGRRQFLHLPADRPVALDGGGQLRDVTIAYETWGSSTPTALERHPRLPRLDRRQPRRRPDRPRPPDAGLVGGHGRARPAPLDTDRYFVVCANVLGGCQGTTGPSSIDPTTGRPYGPRFPVVTIRDMVRNQAALADHLGVARWLTRDRRLDGRHAGARVGDHVPRPGALARSRSPRAREATAQQIAWSAVGRRAIRLDPGWRGGDYYDAEPGDGPARGPGRRPHARPGHVPLRRRVHRPVRARAGRSRRRRFELWQRFEVERYLDYHGDKLVRRFDAN